MRNDRVACNVSVLQTWTSIFHMSSEWGIVSFLQRTDANKKYIITSVGSTLAICSDCWVLSTRHASFFKQLLRAAVNKRVKKIILANDDEDDNDKSLIQTKQNWETRVHNKYTDIWLFNYLYNPYGYSSTEQSLARIGKLEGRRPTPNLGNEKTFVKLTVS